MQEYQKQAIELVKNEKIKERVFKNDGSWSVNKTCAKANIENMYKCFEAMYLFDNLLEKYNEVPNQDFYVEEYIKLYRQKIKTNDPFMFEVGDDFINSCIKWRADRAYKAAIIELVTQAQLEKMGYEVIADKYLDWVMGVDIVAFKASKMWLIHITKDTDFSREKMTKKGSYSGFKINKQSVKFRRDFTEHVALYYQNEECKANTIENGLPFFRCRYIRQQLNDDKAIDVNDEDNELNRFVKRINEIEEYSLMSNKFTYVFM
ncbi:MAG TPA: hypothetical protein DIW15_00215 [Bavariicoccus seileri]|uniref:Uncharacterized protein n=1 Tax=Bavariicoccus seileri TaxID=549685 RepID=A0A3D4S2T5_9ENTE|nr:hypothetical protein [Bavariicoccus seileri]HCS93119.1 hypothetical protein [Bavariicoccus seileri]